MGRTPRAQRGWRFGRGLRSLRARMTALLLAGMAGFLGILIYGNRAEERLLRDAADLDVRDIARRAAVSHGVALESTTQLLNILARLPEVRGGQEPACSELMREVTTAFPIYANLGVADRNGKLLCSAIAPEPTGGPSTADRPWFRRALESDEVVAGDYQIGRLTRLPTLNLALAVRRENEVLSVVFAAVDLTRFAESLAAGDTDATVILLDKQGTVLTRTQDGDWRGRSITDTPLWKAITADPNGTARVPGLDGVMRVFAFHAIPVEGETAAYLAYGVPERGLYSAARLAFSRTMLAVGALAVAMLVGAWIAGSLFIVTPIARIHHRAELLAQGDLGARVRARGTGELAELGRTFDVMADRLAAAIRAREDFVSVAAHELRTPLTGLMLQLQLLGTQLRRDGPEEDRDKLAGRVDTAVAQAHRLGTLLESLLSASHLRRGTFELRTERVELEQLVADTISRMRALATSAGSRLELEATEPLWGMWDPLRLEQVVSNLLSNAIKYGRGRPVHLTLRREDGAAVLTVEDEGVGIGAEDLPFVFEAYARARTGKAFRGLGLGLHVTRQIVEAHGGTITAEYEADRGSRFTVRLPLADGVTPTA